MGVAERVVDLARSETWVGPLNGLDRVTGMDSEIDEVHRDAGADNNGVAATDRRIFVHVEVFRLNWLRHDLAFRLWTWGNPTSTASRGQANRVPLLAARWTAHDHRRALLGDDLIGEGKRDSTTV